MSTDEIFYYIMIGIGMLFMGWAIADHLCGGFKNEIEDGEN